MAATASLMCLAPLLPPNTTSNVASSGIPRYALPSCRVVLVTAPLTGFPVTTHLTPSGTYFFASS